MLYIASPFSHPDPAIRKQRYLDVCKFTATKVLEGFVAYAPIVHGYHLTPYIGTDWDAWSNVCLGMLDKTTELYVLKLEGWETSVGVREEIEYAKDLGLPITYIDWPVLSTEAQT